jgi:hypothetical protein
MKENAMHAMHDTRRLQVIRTGTVHLTITDAHPYHVPLGRTDHHGAGIYVAGVVPQCPWCRHERGTNGRDA